MTIEWVRGVKAIKKITSPVSQSINHPKMNQSVSNERSIVVEKTSKSKEAGKIHFISLVMTRHHDGHHHTGTGPFCPKRARHTHSKSTVAPLTYG